MSKFSDFTDAYPFPTIAFQKWQEYVRFRSVEIRKPALEIGIADLRASRLFFQPRAFDVGDELDDDWGTDWSDIHARVEKFDMRAIPYKNAFNTIVAVHVIDHVEEPEQAFKSVAKALKPGGIFAFSGLTHDHDEDFLRKYKCVTFLNESEIRELCKKAGLELEEYTEFLTGKVMKEWVRWVNFKIDRLGVLLPWTIFSKRVPWIARPIQYCFYSAFLDERPGKGLHFFAVARKKGGSKGGGGMK